MTIVFTLLGFFLIAGLLIYLTALDARRWRKKIESALLPMGFEVCLASEEKAALAQRLLIVNPHHQGKRLLMHLYRRASANGSHNLYFCDYRFASASGKSRGVQLLLICLISRELDLPRVSIVSIPETFGIASKLFQRLSETLPMPSLERIKTGDVEFDRNFFVYANAGEVNQVLPLLERISPTLRAKGDACLDAQGDSLILSSIEMGADLPRHTFDSQKLSRLIDVASNLFETTRYQSEEA